MDMYNIKWLYVRVRSKIIHISLDNENSTFKNTNDNSLSFFSEINCILPHSNQSGSKQLK